MSKPTREELIAKSGRLKEKFRKSSSLDPEKVKKMKHKNYHITGMAKIGFNKEGQPIQNIYISEDPNATTGTKFTIVGDFFDIYMAKIDEDKGTISIPELSLLTPRKKPVEIDGKTTEIEEYWLS